MIAQPGGDHLEAFAIGRHLAGEGVRLRVGEAATLRGARQHLVVGKGAREAGVLQRFGLGGGIAAGDVEALSVGRERDGMIAVFAASFDFAQQRLLIELVRALRVAQPPESGGVRLFVHHHIQAAKGVEQPVRSGDVCGQFLHLRHFLAADRRRRQAIESAVLIAGDEPSLIVHREADP